MVPEKMSQRRLGATVRRCHGNTADGICATENAAGKKITHRPTDIPSVIPEILFYKYHGQSRLDYRLIRIRDGLAADPDGGDCPSPERFPRTRAEIGSTDPGQRCLAHPPPRAIEVPAAHHPKRICGVAIPSRRATSVSRLALPGPAISSQKKIST